MHRDRLSGRVAPNFALHHAVRGASAHGESKIVVMHQGKVEIGPLQVHKRPHSQRWVTLSTCSRAGWAGFQGEAGRALRDRMDARVADVHPPSAGLQSVAM